MKNNIFTKFFGRSKELDTNALISDMVGWRETGKINTLLHRGDNQYENGYGSIQAISKQFFSAVPFAIDAKGKPQKQTAITDVLGHPNKDMSGLDFREALALMTLVHNKVYIRVWHTGNSVTPNNIKGLTFLEGVHEFEDGKGTVYQTPQGDQFREDEVIVIKNINPYELSEGYSTANAVRRWANIDDFIAAYQTGFFENGAVPAGQMTITAPTTQEFNDIVGNLKRNNQGARNNNNIVYSYAPIDPVTGKPAQGSVVFTPYNVANKDLALKDLFDQVAKKVDSAYGVPPSIRGDNSNNTWASVRVDQEIFIDNCVRPFATKIWTRFTHELNRITGGLGYALVVDIETPHIAEEDKEFAEAQSTSTATLLSLLALGYTLQSAVEALELDESFLALKEAPKAEPVAPVAAEDDTTAVDNGDEVDDSPDTTKSIDAIDVTCPHCKRYLFKATGTTVVEDMPCPKCKAHLNFKIINPLGNDKTHEFKFVETAPKDWKQVAYSKQITDESKALITDKIEQVIRNQMERQIDRVDVKTKALGPVDDAEAEVYAKEILSIVTPLITSEGMKQFLLARLIDGIEGSTEASFVLDDTQIAKYTTYLTNVAKGYAEDTQLQIKSVLEEGIGAKLPIQEVKKNLANVMQTDEWRVKRLALSETNRAGNAGSIYAMEQIQKDEQITINKIWQARPDACEYCKAMDGTKVGVSESFVEVGGEIKGVDGGVLTNNFVTMDVPQAHPNCGCYVTYEVEHE